MKHFVMNPAPFIHGIKALLEKNRDSFTLEEIRLLEDTCGLLESLDKVEVGYRHKLVEIIFWQLLRCVSNPEVLERIGDYLKNL